MAAAASSSNLGAVSRVRQWVLSNFASSWFLLAPLLAAYAPRRLFQTYFNLFLRRHARRLLNVVDPYVSIDILHCPAAARYSSLQPVAETDNTYEEVKAYLSGTAARRTRASAAHHQTKDGRERRCQRLTFHNRHRLLVIDEYLPHVRRQGRDILFRNRRRRLFSNNKTLDYDSLYYKAWSYVDFNHPTTFDTLAMDPAKKKAIMDDLDEFRNSRDFYRRTGKPWKRGYLLYGPPGTGKSTMIAAMANYLNYDIYDVELTVVRNNNGLRRLLIETTTKSIIVIEDIDCSLDLTGARAMRPAPPTSTAYERSDVTLSGLLNFIDGLWSACGGERVVVFTTNHIDKLDPALIRRGRMDMRIEMSYCGFEAFKTLAKNYLDVHSHRLFGTVQELLQGMDVTPADVAEGLMSAKRAGCSVDSSMELFVEELKKRKEEEDKAKKKEEEAKAG
ncbi:LOW QUALITY PROTEIN: hypothetical protein U9M48_012026 [Paspalum notatum var. saurae]|uniref:AAA+ ATPase domain-containing protein n=1 Tax=Paspalum notatum var. saurae TaxID=547442 RepID=A0AAQ3WI64_PASNO